MRHRPSAILTITVVAGLTAIAQPAVASDAGGGSAKSTQSARARTASPAVERKMAAQQLLVAAAVRLHNVITARHYAGFTSISLSPNAVELRWKGAVPAPVRASVAAEKTVRVRVIPARYSRQQLKTAERQVFADIKTSAGPVFGVRVPADGNGLVALSTRAQAKANLRGLRARTLRGSSVGLRVEVAPAPELSASRIDDTAPFYGGAQLSNPGGGTCSAGLGVARGTQRFLLTAGHCGWAGGTFKNGNGGLTVGVASQEHAFHDLLLIPTSAGGRVYDGGGLKYGETRTQFTKAVSGWAPTFPGEWLCQSGAKSGTVCKIQKSGNLSYSYCDRRTGECYGDLVAADKRDGVAVRGGDSGGPVFTLDGLKVTAKGTVSGQGRYPFRLSYNGKCLDADARHLGVNGTRLQLWTCNGTPQQRFAVRWDGSIVSETSDGKFCVDADLNTIANNGTVLQLWTCNGSAQQRWLYNGEGSGDIRSAVNGRCIDADLNTIARDGTRMQLWDCNGQNQQRWSVSSNVLYQDFATASQDFGITPITG